MADKKCPLIGKKCIEHQCVFYVHLVGMNPQTGQPTDEWNCAVAWLPMLLIENANEVRKSAASSDKVANEVRGLKETPIIVDVAGLLHAKPIDSKAIEHKNGIDSHP